ncbi:hypothetical protein EYR38_008204 [Pleurotus pulmonarius]|nr:hypothetical protein EYR38_008204 [Pleurotus pulmonarius]
MNAGSKAAAQGATGRSISSLPRILQAHPWLNVPCPFQAEQIPAPAPASRDGYRVHVRSHAIPRLRPHTPPTRDPIVEIRESGNNSAEASCSLNRPRAPGSPPFVVFGPPGTGKRDSVTGTQLCDLT